MTKAAVILKEDEQLRRLVDYFVPIVKIQDESGGKYFDYEVEVNSVMDASVSQGYTKDPIIKFDFYRVHEPRKNGFYMKEERTHYCTWLISLKNLTALHKILNEARTNNSKKYELDCTLKLLFGEDSRYVNQILRDLWVTCRRNTRIGVYFRTEPSNTN